MLLTLIIYQNPPPPDFGPPPGIGGTSFAPGPDPYECLQLQNSMNEASDPYFTGDRQREEEEERNIVEPGDELGEQPGEEPSDEPDDEPDGDDELNGNGGPTEDDRELHGNHARTPPTGVADPRREKVYLFLVLKTPVLIKVSAKRHSVEINNPNAANLNSRLVADVVHATETSYASSSPRTAISTPSIQPCLRWVHLQNH